MSQAHKPEVAEMSGKINEWFFSINRCGSTCVRHVMPLLVTMDLNCRVDYCTLFYRKKHEDDNRRKTTPLSMWEELCHNKQRVELGKALPAAQEGR